MEEKPSTPHILIVAFPSQGNVNPALRLAKRLATKGLTVTFSSTRYIAHRLISNNSNNPILSTSPLTIGRGHLHFDFFSDGWAVDDPRHRKADHLAEFMLSLESSGSSSLADLIRRQPHPVSCVVSDIFVPWVVDVAHSFSILSAVLWIQSCAVFSIYYHYFNSLASFPSESDPNDVTVSLPFLPMLGTQDLPTFILNSNPHKCMTEAIRSLFNKMSTKANWLLANTFEELELDIMKSISATANRRMIAVGPLAGGSESDGSWCCDMWIADAECLKWLDSQEARSVVYVALGSGVILSRDEMGEMASGLMSSGSPFLWVVRDDSRHLLPQGFVEDSRGKGMVIGWSLQERVLSHRAIACFVSHCGWNSTIESLTAGVRAIAYPNLGDQQPNAKFIADVYGVGIRLKEPVKREELKKCLEEAVRGEKAEFMRCKALEWKEAARKAAADGGSSDRNLQSFVEEIMIASAASGGTLDSVPDFMAEE